MVLYSDGLHQRVVKHNGEMGVQAETQESACPEPQPVATHAWQYVPKPSKLVRFKRREATYKLDQLRVLRWLAVHGKETRALQRLR